MIVAIDGPVAAGKGTLARRVAEHFGFAHLDTGMLYRAVGKRLLDAGHAPDDRAAAERAARSIAPDELGDPGLRAEAVGEAASVVAAMTEVRAALLGYQRRFAEHPPGGAAGAVIDGRDIGTVVCPDADIKIFVWASVETRARRRYLELQARGVDIAESQVLADLKRRDRRDSARSAAPLQRAQDAYLLDTTNLDIEAAFRAVKQLITERMRKD